jgi:4-hydroxythreonine-4-phosphate dehydrogenase
MAGVIGITLGDPAGVGPEVVRAALASGRLNPAFEYRLIGDPTGVTPGVPTAESAKAAVAALEEAAALVISGKIDAVVTGPIHKANSQAAGFAFPGQTEFFAARAGVTDFAMLLTGGSLTVALVTAHISLREVPLRLSTPEIVRVGHLLTKFLRLRLNGGLLGRALRIAVAGLNPHAGEQGAMGREEIEIITPAIHLLQQTWGEKAVFSGPISPDTLFFRAAAGEFDAVLCMYHDQGLIPLKLHAFDEGVNVTLGLPFFRTSPDHGTAFEIAGRNIARPESTLRAIQLACELSQARKSA